MRSLVAIPVFNEKQHVGDVLDEVLDLHQDVLVVDDGSTDGTSELLDARGDIHLLRHPENRGYGQSLIDAFAFSQEKEYDWLITMDCDRQHQPAQIQQFIDLASYCDCDLVSGSRYMIDMPGNDAPPPERQGINKRITRLANDVLGLEITDAFCGYKAYQVPSLRWLAPTIPGYAFPMQHWVQVARAGFKMRELAVPIIYNDPNRHFGGLLDDSDVRYQHYLDVLTLELIQPRQEPWQMMRLQRDWPASLRVTRY